MQSVAPCQEVVIESPKDVNEHMVPIRHTTYEPGLTVGSGIRCVTGEHFDGGSDLGYNRMNFRWAMSAPSRFRPAAHVAGQQVLQDRRAGADHHVLGVPPACTLLAGAAFGYAIMPQGCDEIGIAGAVRARRSAWSRRAPSTPWRWPTPRSCWKATSTRATAASRPRRPRTRRAGPPPFPSGVGGLYGKILQGANVPRHR